ncbi:hypothetical protein L1887_10992 [Cichorium endivia]|nr:hypothetical protein L1887_10992 [Cichorium endivia]
MQYSHHSVEDEEALRWAALEKLPTYKRIRTTIFKSYIPADLHNQTPADKLLLDVRELDPNARQDFIDKTFKIVEEDNERMALLLGPPSSGKTTLLLALAGKRDPSLKATAIEGDACSLITYYTLRVR